MSSAGVHPAEPQGQRVALTNRDADPVSSRAVSAGYHHPANRLKANELINTPMMAPAALATKSSTEATRLVMRSCPNSRTPANATIASASRCASMVCRVAMVDRAPNNRYANTCPSLSTRRQCEGDKRRAARTATRPRDRASLRRRGRRASA